MTVGAPEGLLVPCSVTPNSRPHGVTGRGHVESSELGSLVAGFRAVDLDAVVVRLLSVGGSVSPRVAVFVALLGEVGEAETSGLFLIVCANQPLAVTVQATHTMAARVTASP